MRVAAPDYYRDSRLVLSFSRRSAGRPFPSFPAHFPALPGHATTDESMSDAAIDLGRGPVALPDGL